MTDDVTIRRATPADLGAMTALHIASAADLANLLPDWLAAPMREPLHAELTRGEFAKALEDADSTVLVAEVDGRVVGLALAVVERHTDDLIEAPFLTVEYLETASAFRGRGVGRALMHEVETIAAARGIVTLELLVWSCNSPAIALYESLGYVPLEMRMVKRLG